MRKLPLLVVLLLCACSHKGENEEKRWVRFEEVKAEKTHLRIYSGYAKPYNQVHLSFRVGGRLEEISFLVGSEVAKGEVLARLDPKDYVLKVEEAQSALLEAKAQKRKAEANYERIATLYETDCASRSELDGARTAFESCEAKRRAAKSHLDLANLQLSYTILKAPMEGVVASKLVEVNENVAQGQFVCEVHSLGRSKLVIALPEKLINEIRVGARAEVVFNALPKKLFSAFVTEVGVASPKTTVFPLTLELVEESEEIRPGMTADVIFQIPLEKERLLITPQAIFEREGKHFVYVLNEEEGCQVARKREVVLGELTSEGMVILEGVFENEKVITAGIYQIEEGERVIISCD